MTQQRGAQVELRSPQRGDRRRLLAIATRNAELALEGARLADERVRTRGDDALEELRDALGLESLPQRIECYDISTLGGKNQYASMVVFEQGVARSDLYRAFAIRHGRLDDYASIGEVISRRFARLSEVGGDRSFSRSPDLIVIDGGKGQLNAAIVAMRDVNAPRVSAIGLAKRDEEVFLPGRSAPVLLDAASPGLLLLREIRDEAHRFALRHHRRRRGVEATASVLDNLPGVGPVRRRALLLHFETAEAILAATSDQLEAVPGLPAKTARAIHANLDHFRGSTSAAFAASTDSRHSTGDRGQLDG